MLRRRIAFAAPLIALALTLGNPPSGCAEPSGSGADLYATHCAGCHRPLARTAIPDRSVNRIRSAINVFPSMSRLRTLSEADLAALAAILSTAPAPVALR